MFGTSPFVPMASTLFTSVALCVGLTFRKFETDRKKTSTVDYLFFYGAHIIMWVLVLANLAEIFYTVIPEMDLSASEKVAFIAEEVSNSRTLCLWSFAISLICLITATVRIIYKKTKGLLWLALFGLTNFIGSLATNMFLDLILR